jgi:hypothetical protein
MNAVRKAIAAAVTGTVAWASAVVVSTPEAVTSGEWVSFGGIWATVVVVWLVPNEVG